MTKTFIKSNVALIKSIKLIASRLMKTSQDWKSQLTLTDYYGLVGKIDLISSKGEVLEIKAA